MPGAAARSALYSLDRVCGPFFPAAWCSGFGFGPCMKRRVLRPACLPGRLAFSSFRLVSGTLRRLPLLSRGCMLLIGRCSRDGRSAGMVAFGGTWLGSLGLAYDSDSVMDQNGAVCCEGREKKNTPFSRPPRKWKSVFRLRRRERIEGRTLQKTTTKRRKLDLVTITLRMLFFVSKKC